MIFWNVILPDGKSILVNAPSFSVNAHGQILFPYDDREGIKALFSSNCSVYRVAEECK